jgi:hypothetical protein
MRVPGLNGRAGNLAHRREPGSMHPYRAAIALTLAAVIVPATSQAATGLPYVQGPDIEPVTMPVRVIDVISDARWSCSETPAVRSFTVPVAPSGNGWDRIILQVESIQTGDPWDRLLIASINGAEMLRATTPRTRMTLRKDVTQYADLMPEGATIPASLSIGSYVGSIEGRLRLEFYDAEVTAALVAAPAARVIAPMLARRITHTLVQPASTSASVDFGAAPTRALIDLTTSGHGAEEFWFQEGGAVSVPERKVTRTRVFHIAVDGTEVGTATAMPYIYALLGFGGPNANIACVGPGNAAHGDALHPLMWWTVQRELDRAGLHVNSGEIPQYRIEITDPAVLALLSGERTVTVSVENMPSGPAAGVWITSLSFLLD